MLKQMKYSLVLLLFVAATLSTVIASPRRTRMAKSENSTTVVQEADATDQETVSTPTVQSAQPVEETPEEKDPEPSKDEQEIKNDADLTESITDDHDIVEPAITDYEEETVPNQTADNAPVSQQEETAQPAEENQHQEYSAPSTDEKDSKSFLSLFLNGLDDIKTAINELQKSVNTFFISTTNVDGTAADVPSA
uniref:Uncharacterized protein n=1 Tax=Anopheles culicifacies TaxID=139723 RepID=A0A182ME94_9DIPT